ncbi:MAG: helix-turn-helix transcriptional regulator [Eggerthellaceae bacterium]|nr:helix-turn-helix transcriptional regulator [Eggerthellaceae bacterium]
MGVSERVRKAIRPDRSMCLLCAWILAKSASLHSYTTAFGAPQDSMAYITSPLFQLGSSVGILVSSAIILFLALKSRIPRFSLPVFAPAAILVAVHLCAILGARNLFPSESVFFVTGAIWGICTNLISLSLVELLAEEKSPATIALYLAMGSLAAAAVSSTLQDISPLWATLACAILLVFAERLIAFCRKDLRRAGTGMPNVSLDAGCKEPIGQGNLRACLSENFPILLAFFVSEAIVGMVNMFAYTNVDALSISTMLPISGMTICAMAFLAVIAMTSSTPSSSMLFSFVIPAVIAALLLLPFIGGSHGSALSTALSASYHFVAITAVYCYVRSCKKHGVSLYVFAAIVCSAERIVLLLGLGLGLLLGNVIEGDFFIRVTALAVISAYALGIVVFAFGMTKKRIEGVEFSPDEVISGIGRNNDELDSDPKSLDAHAPAEKDVAAELAEKYGLTGRETDVLKLLARGRDVAFIGETLHLSRNTVQGYVKALYAKLNVHSRRELHDLLDALGD